MNSAANSAKRASYNTISVTFKTYPVGSELSLVFTCDVDISVSVSMKAQGEIIHTSANASVTLAQEYQNLPFSCAYVYAYDGACFH